MLHACRLLARPSVVMALLAAAVLVGSLRAERIGDRLQVALPLLAWACTATKGEAAEFFLRYGVMFVTAHGFKQGLGEAPMNLRPNGGTEGFPSAHTSTAVLGASRLAQDCLAAHPVGQAAVVLAAAFVGSSRIDAGKHDIWQVLAGALLGYGADRALRQPSPARRRVGQALRATGRTLARGLAWARPRAALLAAFLIAVAAGRSTANELEIALYGGVQGAVGARVEGTDISLGDFSFDADWEGRPLKMPPYWGLRATWWQPSDWGFGVELNHAKIYATDETLALSGFSRLEMTDGLNLVTVNAFRRFPTDSRVTPYLGAGLGFAVPHVEVTSPGGAITGYQVTGPAAVWMAGVQYRLSDRWSLLAEYKGSHSRHDADLAEGGTLRTNVTTHALNVGAALRF